MIPLSNAWSPSFARPMLAPMLVQRPPMTLGQAELPAAVGNLVSLGVAGLTAAFTYGIARETRSPMVRTTGYILAGLGALSGVILAGSLLMGAVNK